MASCALSLVHLLLVQSLFAYSLGVAECWGLNKNNSCHYYWMLLQERDGLGRLADVAIWGQCRGDQFRTACDSFCKFCGVLRNTHRGKLADLGHDRTNRSTAACEDCNGLLVLSSVKFSEEVNTY